jgi:hypothetical protein
MKRFFLTGSTLLFIWSCASPAQPKADEEFKAFWNPADDFHHSVQ